MFGKSCPSFNSSPGGLGLQVHIQKVKNKYMFQFLSGWIRTAGAHSESQEQVHVSIPLRVD